MSMLYPGVVNVCSICRFVATNLTVSLDNLITTHYIINELTENDIIINTGYYDT